MKIKLLLAFLAILFTSCATQEEGNANPFVMPKPAKAAQANVGGDSFETTKQSLDEDHHLWKDYVVKPGGANAPNYIKIVGALDRGADQATLFFRVDVDEYQNALAHPDRNRGVALMSGQLASPDFYCWLRPFRVTSSTAEFVVLVSSKNASRTHIVFMPHDGNHRYLYNLGQVVATNRGGRSNR